MAGPRKLNPRRLKALLERNFDVVKERSNDEEVVIICPEDGCPDKTGNRSFNLRKGVTNCWRCTTCNGSVFVFLRRHGVEIQDTDLTEVLDESNPADLVAQLVDPVVAPAKGDVSLPEGFTPLAAEPDGVYARLISLMARRKRLYLQDFIDAGVGFTRVGQWEPYAIFPVYESGKLVYYQGRTYSTAQEGGSTKRFPSKSEVPFGSSNWLYGYDNLFRGGVQTVVVVESILNVLSLRWELATRGLTGIVPVAVFKHKISAPQLSKLLLAPVPEICIMYDGDATECAWQEAKKLANSRVATVATMPVGIDANDNAAMAVDRILQRKAYTPVNELIDTVCALA